MPLDHRIDEEANLLVTKLTGVIDAAALLAQLESVKQDARLRPGYRSFFDMTDAGPCSIDGTIVRRAAGISRRFDEKLGHVRVAVLAPSDVAYGLARMYATLTDGLQRQVRVFREATEAHEWLGIEPEGDLAG